PSQVVFQFLRQFLHDLGSWPKGSAFDFDINRRGLRGPRTPTRCLEPPTGLEAEFGFDGGRIRALPAGVFRAAIFVTSCNDEQTERLTDTPNFGVDTNKLIGLIQPDHRTRWLTICSKRE